MGENCNYSKEELKYFIELTLRQQDIDNQLEQIKKIIDYLVVKK